MIGQEPLEMRGKFHNNEFISAICHELRNPLNAITAFASLIKATANSPQGVLECGEYANEIGEAAEDLNDIVSDLLDVTAIDSGNFSVDLKKEINAADAIYRSIRLNKDYALKRKISLTTAIEKNLDPIRLDSKRLKQITTNLISNAVKYSPENSEIKVEAKQVTTGEGVAHGGVFVKKFLEINISDHGFGMTELQVAQAFEKYTTFKNPNSGKVDSFGLGLAITKQLVELQRGTIEITSKLNKGTEVKLKFPY